MSEETAAGRQIGERLRGAAWAIGAAFASAALCFACMSFFGIAALALESGVSRTASIAVNWIAMVSMVASYSAALTLIMRFLVRRYDVPRTAWLGLLAFPACWTLLVVAYPETGYASPPAIVSGIGLVVAGLVVGRRRPAYDSGEA